MNLPLRVAIAGNVDHGKSTIIGRLLSDSYSVREDKLQKVRAHCEGRRFEYAFLLDALEEEQQQGITIDVTEVAWTFEGRRFTIIDTPGHREFLKNMIGGAAQADAAVLVVDVQEGIKVQFQRQVAILSLLGISRTLVVVNKMDLVDWSEKEFISRSAEIRTLFEQTHLSEPQILPMAAWLGANLLHRAEQMPWYKGSTLAEALRQLPSPCERTALALRFPLQDVYKFADKRIYVGRVEAGTLRVGETLKFLPSGREGRIKSIESTPSRLHAVPGDAIGITLEEPLFLESGELGCSPARPARISKVITADLFWLAARPLVPGKRYGLRCATAELQAQVEALETVLDPETLQQTSRPDLEAGNIGRVRLSLEKALAHDFFKDCAATGRFVLVEDHRVVGGGRILPDHRAYLSREFSMVGAEQRTAHFGHPGVVLWFTGLSGSGKSTLGRGLERRLFARGCNIAVLDGDNLRQGLSSDLGFSDVDRSENNRRAAEVAALMADVGLIVVTATVSPFRSDRERARKIVGKERFVEIFVDCPLSVCEQRDPKKLYQRARTGEVAQFTGVTSRYEPPDLQTLELHLRTDQMSCENAVDQILGLLHQRNWI